MFLRGCLTVPQQENRQHDFFANYATQHVPQHVPPFHARVAFPEPVAHRMPTSDQPSAAYLRQLALCYLHRPGSQVDLVSIGAGAAGRCKVVIVVESVDVL